MRQRRQSACTTSQADVVRVGDDRGGDARRDKGLDNIAAARVGMRPVPSSAAWTEVFDR